LIGKLTSMKSNKYLMLAGLMGLLAVGIGAFGAHGLKPLLSAKQVGIFETGVAYHFYHTLAIFGVAVLLRNEVNAWWSRAGWAFGIGILLFSGSLYLLACRDLLGIESTSVLGPLTPIGGVFFMLGWGSLIIGAWKRN